MTKCLGLYVNMENFEASIANNGNANCVVRVSNVKLVMGEYICQGSLFVMNLEGVNVVLRSRWLETLTDITVNLLKLYIQWL